MNGNRLRSSIDIGTNTALLLVARQNNQNLTPVYEEQQIPRLGRGVDAGKMLANDSIERLLVSLRHYKEVLETKFPDAERPVITATSAVRDARNKEELIKRIKVETGWDLRILSGKEEAEWTYAGALSVFNLEDKKKYAIVDIGGGSTEISLGEGSKLREGVSFDIGCVRYTERFLHDSPPKAEDLFKAEAEIRKALLSSDFRFSADGVQLFGVAGTITSLAYIHKEMQTYDAAQLNGLKLYSYDIEKLFQEFKTMTAEEMIQSYPVVMKGRADVFLAGIMILREVMKLFGFSNLLVSTGGIRHGSLIKTF